MDRKLVGYLTKLHRAQEHLDVLEADIAVFERREPYELAGDLKSEPGFFLLRLKLLEDPRQRWGAIIGDIAHNYRSALDHLAWQLVKGNGGNAGWETKFPIYSSEADYLVWREPRPASDPRGKRSDPLAGIPEVIIAAIEDMQPYKRGDEADEHPLALLSRISNRDKHRLPVILFAGVDPEGPLTLWTRSASLSDMEKLVGAFSDNPGQWADDGDALARFRHDGSPGHPDASMHFDLKVALDQAKVPVLDALNGVKSFIYEEITPRFGNLI